MQQYHVGFCQHLVFTIVDRNFTNDKRCENFVFSPVDPVQTMACKSPPFQPTTIYCAKAMLQSGFIGLIFSKPSLVIRLSVGASKVLASQTVDHMQPPYSSLESLAPKLD